MKINDLFKYNYVSIDENGFCHTFGRVKHLNDEGDILRLADLHIISKSQIRKIDWKNGNSTIEILMDDNRRIVLGIE